VIFEELNVNVFVIRHGETAWSLSGQHTGTTDIPLTDNGRRLAERMRPVLSKKAFALVRCSPMQRARETCELAGLDDRAVIDPDLAEWNYGQYEGLTPKQIHEGAPGWLIFRDGCPGGESPEEVGARVDRARPTAMWRYSPTDMCCAFSQHGGSNRRQAPVNISCSIRARSAFSATTAIYPP
jgi:broad specificity phosphatase PhoE